VQDFMQGCMEDLKTRDVRGFQDTFCQRCKNPECVHAKWSKDKFSHRVAQQVDRLLHAPTVQQSDMPKYAQIADFLDASREALRLELSSRRNDWTVPEENPTILVPLGLHRPPEPDPEAVLMAETKAIAEAERPPPVVADEIPLPPPAPVNPATTPSTPVGNVPPPPPEGVMVGGGPPPPPRTVKPPDPVDTWEIKPTVQKVQKGARIQLGQPPDKKP
jgi:hypothetical protein